MSDLDDYIRSAKKAIGGTGVRGSVAPNAFNGQSLKVGGNLSPLPQPLPPSKFGSVDGNKITGNLNGKPGSLGSGSSGGGSGSGGEVGGGAIDYSAIDALYAMLDNNASETGIKNKALSDAALARITANQADANKDLYQQYTGSRDILTGQANNLGVDYNATEMGKNYDLDLRRLQETSDQNLNIDKSWFEKMGALDAGQIAAIRLGLQLELGARKAGMAGGGSSGGGGSYSGGGGGGSKKKSSSGDPKVTDTYFMDDADFQARYDELYAENPVAAGIFEKQYWANEANALAAQAAVMEEIGSLPKAGQGFVPYDSRNSGSTSRGISGITRNIGGRTVIAPRQTVAIPDGQHPNQIKGNQQRTQAIANQELALLALRGLTSKGNNVKKNSKIVETYK